jgi:hypothetical protein
MHYPENIDYEVNLE